MTHAKRMLMVAALMVGAGAPPMFAQQAAPAAPAQGGGRQGGRSR